MSYFAGQEMQSYGQHVSMVGQRDVGADLMALTGLEKEKIYFISTCSVSSSGETITRKRFITEDETTKKN